MSNSLAALQSRFLDYVSDGDTAIVGDIADAGDGDRERRLSIYFNAYRARLRSSVETDHPVLGRYLGDDLFDSMTAAYIGQHPSSFTSLRHFCDRLPAFLKTQAPFAGQPVLGELAAWERVLMDVFDASESARLNDTFPASLQPDQWPALRLTLHPSARTFDTTWNCVEIWRAMKAGREPPPAEQLPERSWLLWRNRDRLSEFRSLPDDERAVIRAVADGANFATLCDTLIDWHQDKDVAARALSLLTLWLQDGIVAAADTDEPPAH